MAPFLYLAIVQHRWAISFILCLFAGGSDFLDGYLARKMNQTSFFGEIFDPFADKVAVTAIYIAFWRINAIPDFLFYGILGRDMLLILGSLFVMKYQFNIPLHPLFLSKINTFFQFFLCVWIVSFNAMIQAHLLSAENSFYKNGTTCIIVITFVLTFLSGAQYAKRFFSHVF